jgi:hypothetical protein
VKGGGKLSLGRLNRHDITLQAMMKLSQLCDKLGKQAEAAQLKATIELD